MTTKTEQSLSYLGSEQIHEQWQSDFLNADMDRLYDLAFERIVQSLAPAPNATILDAGCGYCFHAVRLAKGGLRVTGVDFSKAALREARTTIKRAGFSDRIQIQQGDLLELPFADASFDYVHCWGVLMHIPEIEKALAESIRVLKPDGKLIVMENNMRSLHVSLWEPMLRGLKYLLKRPMNERRRTERGIEEWSPQDSGGLMVRKTDMDWLVRFCSDHGLRLTDRFASQFTEFYTHLPWRPLKRIIYGFNQVWLEKIRSPRGAMGNVLIFHKALETAA